MDTVNRLKDTACKAIDERQTLLQDLSTTIWGRPELAFEEHFAHAKLTETLANEGFQVRKHFPLQTSFVATYGHRGNGGLRIGVCCEYDALPGIGHGCGHNLIAEAGIAAGIGLKNAVMALDDNRHEICVFGTPAEENSAGGKIHLINSNVFEGLDLCMMVHPFTHDVLAPASLSLESIKIYFRANQEKLATNMHSNPLDAAVACYTNVSLLRQQMKPKCRVHGIFTEAGVHPDVRTNQTCLYFMIRGPTDEERNVLKEKVVACANGAAQSTGCSVTVDPVNVPYSCLKTNETLAKLYEENLQILGLTVKEVDVAHGSTDMGNVSHVVPSIQPKFKIPTNSSLHSEGFAASALMEGAQAPTLRVAKAMAMSAIDCMLDKRKALSVMQDFRDR